MRQNRFKCSQASRYDGLDPNSHYLGPDPLNRDVVQWWVTPPRYPEYISIIKLSMPHPVSPLIICTGQDHHYKKII